MRSQNVLGFVGLATILLGCAQEPSSTVDQSEIYTTYSANYDDTNQQLTASAIFNFGGPTGTYLNLDGQSTILFDQTPLTETTDMINQALYNLTITAPFSGTAHTFSYTDNSGKTYVNPVQIPVLPSVSYSTTSVSISKTLTATWSTADLVGADGINVSLFLRGYNSGTTTGGYVSRPAPGDLSQSRFGTITFTSDDLQSAGVGSYWIQLCRQHPSSLSQPTSVGGTISSSGCTTQTAVQLRN